MNRIDQHFQKLKFQGKKALVAYLTLGFPDLKTNLAQIRKMEKLGVTMVEIGIPFTDPTADGPTIQASSQRALETGVSLKDAMELARQVRRDSQIPLILMGYLNPFLSLPPAKLARNLKASGIDGMIVPDLPPDERQQLKDALDAEGIHLIFLVAPTSSFDRIKLIARSSRGFVYCVSRAGVTGEKSKLSRGLAGLVARIRKETNTPVCVGFGISTPEQLEEVQKIADGAIVGSALIKPFLEETSPSRGLARSLKRLEEIIGAGVQ